MLFHKNTFCQTISDKKWAQSENNLITVSWEINGGSVEEDTRSIIWPHCS